MLSILAPAYEQGYFLSERNSETIDEKSFDVLSSVRLFRYDLQDIGDIRPETFRRVYDEELSYIAEGINRHNFTEFVLHQEDGQLVYFHEGKWRPYMSTLIAGLRTAQAEAKADPRKQFEADRRATDLQRGYQLHELQAGQKLSWFYEFPRQPMVQYGEKFVEDMGFFPTRAMGYLCEAEKTFDGLVLRHQSVDNSDNEAFNAAMLVAEAGGNIEDMTAAYDEVLGQKNGGEHYAGRRLDGQSHEESAWEIVVKHKDLVDYLFKQIEAIARGNLSDQETERAKKRLTYGVWARLKEKLDEQSVGLGPYGYSGEDSIGVQVESAYQSAAARGETLFGCGGSITGENAFLQASGKDVFNMIFGSEKKWFGCHYCGAKQYGNPCASHLYCPACTAEVKDGKVVSTGRGRGIRKGFFDVIADEWTAEWQKWKRDYELAQQEKATKRLAEAQQTSIKNT